MSAVTFQATIVFQDDDIEDKYDLTMDNIQKILNGEDAQKGIKSHLFTDHLSKNNHPTLYIFAIKNE